MDKLIKVLKFLRLLDSNNLLSLTNISVMLVMSKIVTTQATSMQDVALSMIPLMSYMHKRHVSKGDK